MTKNTKLIIAVAASLAAAVVLGRTIRYLSGVINYEVGYFYRGAALVIGAALFYISGISQSVLLGVIGAVVSLCSLLVVRYLQFIEPISDLDVKTEYESLLADSGSMLYDEGKVHTLEEFSDLIKNYEKENQDQGFITYLLDSFQSGGASATKAEIFFYLITLIVGYSVAYRGLTFGSKKEEEEDKKSK